MITTLLKHNLFVDKSFKSKEDALKYFCQLLAKEKYVKNAQAVLQLALAREKQFPTNIGNNVAMPHVLDDVVKEPVILFAKVHQLLWDQDNKSTGKVNYVFFLCYNKKVGETLHMETIQSLSTLLLNDSFIKGLEKVKNTQALINLINDHQKSNLEKGKWLYYHNQKKQSTSTKRKTPSSDKYDVVAVTACPTGVAHTFLAKDCLEKAAREMNVSIKVETQGTEGSRNTLTDDEISAAQGVILALDRSIDTSKFAGKENIVETSTRSVIKNAQAEIKKVLNHEGVNYKGERVSNSSGKIEDANLISWNKFGKRIYQGLMNGVGHMLPFVIFGGILIAIAFMIDAFSFSSEYIQSDPAIKSNFGKLTPTSSWFNQIGGIAFGLMVPILAGYMAFGLVGKAGILPGFVCGTISTGVMQYNGAPWLMDWLPKEQLEMLSNGSGFFGAIGGAILTATMVIVLSKYVFSYLPKSLDAIKNILFMPLIGTFIIAGLFFLINIPLQFINLGFGMLLNLFKDYPALYPLLGLIMGLMMCADLGGPINKAAYVFGTITLSGGNGSIPMAIAMGAGMVPPLAIALSTTIDKKIWTNEQRKNGYVNYVMGLSFISEGAIPYTAEQPKKLIIANLLGGAITGIAIGALQVSSLAPHGGIFVAPLLRCGLSFCNTEALKIGMGITFFLGSIILGSVVEAVIIGWLSRTKWGRNPQVALQA